MNENNAGKKILSLVLLILGAVLAIAAYVFNYGCKLQQESDETL